MAKLERRSVSSSRCVARYLRANLLIAHSYTHTHKEEEEEEEEEEAIDVENLGSDVEVGRDARRL